MRMSTGLSRAMSAIGLVLAVAAPIWAQSPPAAKAWTLPRTSDGRPDLQGVWSNASITTLERPDRYPNLVLKPEEVAKLTADNPQNVRVATEDIATTPKEGLLTGKDLLAGRGYNAFWIDPGTKFGVVRGEVRTAWIIDPPDNRIPWSAEGRKRAAAATRLAGFSDPEARPLGDRCLATGGRTGPPMVNGLYNNHYQIVETPGSVMILSEMIEHARVIPIGAPAGAKGALHHGPGVLRPLFGDSIGWWEGDVLVIETTGFSPLHATHDNPAYLSEHAKVTERFTRIPEGLLYEFTVDDPVFYAKPWRGETTWRDDGARIYEYACQEGNYAMTGILRGARIQEAHGIVPKEQGGE
ncbi:MAG: hypothetical protein ABI740_01530 [Alphaproteobacteria bacterium]